MNFTYKMSEINISELDLGKIEPSESQMRDENQGGSKIVVIGKPGCFAPGTKVLMYDGTTKKVENVNVGDVVMGNDNTPRNVLELCANVDEMYHIKPNKGEGYIVNSQHDLVLVCTGYNSTPKGSLEIISVEEYLKKSPTWQRRYKLFRSSGVQWEEKLVEIDPYLLGVWLGDGTSRTSEITNIDKEVIDYLYEYADENELEVRQKKCEVTYRLKGKTVEGILGENMFLKSLRKYNLLQNKHIPFDYKTGSRQQRLELLAGLIDTDGCLDGVSYEITQKNEQLIDDILFVVRSLGMSGYKKKCRKTCMYKGEKRTGDYFRIHIHGDGVDEIPVKIERKKMTHKRCPNKSYLVTGFDVESKGSGQYYGFRLDGNNLFLLESFDVVKNTGKSVLLKSILYAKKHIFPVGMVFSGTEDANKAFSTHFPETFVYESLDIDRLQSFIRRQKIARQHLENPWAALVIDDCTDDPRVLKDKVFGSLLKNGRHYKMLMILSLQYCMDFPKGLRPSIDGVFILREPNLANRKSLYENFGGIIGDFKTFCDYLDQITDDFTALYIHNRSTSNRVEDNVFWYKAVPPPDEFKFGSKEYWTFHKARFDENFTPAFL